MAHEIIIRTPNHLGDCVMALPMINNLHEVYPDSALTVMVPDQLAQLFEQNPSVENLIHIPQEHVHGLIAVKKGVDLLADKEYDIGYVLPPSFGSAATFKLAGVVERIGYISDGRRLLLTRPLPLPSPVDSEHRAELYFNLLRRATGEDLEFTRPKIFLSGSDTERASEILKGFGIKNDQPYLVIAPQAVAESRRWGSTNYGTLAAGLMRSENMAVLLLGTEDESPAAEEVIAVAVATGVKEKWLVNLAGKTTLRESATIMSGARMFIGNDSGAAHLAAAVGNPLVVLSGADNPTETSPMTNRKRLIYKDSLECISCIKNVCPLKGDAMMKCMKEISVVEVDQAVKEVLLDESN